MSHLCGRLLANGTPCREPIANPEQHTCGRHSVAAAATSRLLMATTGVAEAAAPAGTVQNPIALLDRTPSVCRYYQEPIGVWRCATHGNEQWDVASALGATSECEKLSDRERAEIAAMPDLTPQIMQHMAEHSSVGSVLRGVAQNPSATAQTLRLLGRRYVNTDATVQLWVAHPNLSRQTIRRCVRRSKLKFDRRAERAWNQAAAWPEVFRRPDLPRATWRWAWRHCSVWKNWLTNAILAPRMALNRALASLRYAAYDSKVNLVETKEAVTTMLANPAAPDWVVRKIAEKTQRPSRRWAAMLHPQMSDDMLRRLVHKHPSWVLELDEQLSSPYGKAPAAVAARERIVKLGMAASSPHLAQATK